MAPVPGPFPLVVAFAVPLLPSPGGRAELILTLAVVALARRRLGLTGQRRGADEPDEEHGSHGDRQRRRQV
jgi:hypothetical protein